MVGVSVAPAVLIMLAVSAQFALQAPVNARLAVTTGRVPAALVSFLVGIVGLAVAVLVSGGAGGFADIGEAEAWQFTGGIIGVTFVLTALAAVPVVRSGGWRRQRSPARWSDRSSSTPAVGSASTSSRSRRCGSAAPSSSWPAPP